MQTAIGVDLGGSHVTAGVVTDDGTITSQHELDLTDLAFDKVIDAVVTVVQQALADAGKKVAASASARRANRGRTRASVFAQLRLEGRPWADAKNRSDMFVGKRALRDPRQYTFGISKAQDFALLTLGTGSARLHRGGRRCSGASSARARWPSSIRLRQVRLQFGKVGCFGPGLGRRTGSTPRWPHRSRAVRFWTRRATKAKKIARPRRPASHALRPGRVFGRSRDRASNIISFARR